MVIMLKNNNSIDNNNGDNINDNNNIDNDSGDNSNNITIIVMIIILIN